MQTLSRRNFLAVVGVASAVLVSDGILSPSMACAASSAELQAELDAAQTQLDAS
jgi:hypothetical protein